MQPTTGFDVRTGLQTGLRLDPRLIQQSQIMAMTSAQLSDAIQVELAENPALNTLDAFEEYSEEEILDQVAPRERLYSNEESWESARSRTRDEDSNWLDFVSSGVTLQDHLDSVVRRMPSAIQDQAKWIANQIDKRGYFSGDLLDLALQFECDLDEAERILAAFQNLAQPGIAARNIRECLLLQLKGDNCLEAKLARTIVRRHLEEYGTGRLERLSRKYRVMPKVVESAFRIIVELNPFPAEEFASDRGSVKADRSAPITPDLMIFRSESGWTIEVPGVGIENLCIDRAFRGRLEELAHKRKLTDDARNERRLLSSYVQRAEGFLDAVESRKLKLSEVGWYLVQTQQGFLHTGDYTFLKVLTRTRIAEDIGCHESTISRLTQHKFVQIPNGEVVSFDVFFKPALRLRAIIGSILEQENEDDPLSDLQISGLLADRGIQVSRRTVHKYREQSGLLSSRKRKVA